MKSQILIILISLTCIHTAIINKNQINGPNNVVYQGSNNKIDGRDNQVTGYENTINGHINAVYGSVNQLNGNGNLVAGFGNSVSGKGNLVSGQGNIVLGPDASEQDRQKMNQRLMEVFAARGLGGIIGLNVVQTQSQSQAPSAPATQSHRNDDLPQAATQKRIQQPQPVPVASPVAQQKSSASVVSHQPEVQTKLKSQNTQQTELKAQPTEIKNYQVDSQVQGPSAQVSKRESHPQAYVINQDTQHYDYNIADQSQAMTSDDDLLFSEESKQQKKEQIADKKAEKIAQKAESLHQDNNLPNAQTQHVFLSEPISIIKEQTPVQSVHQQPISQTITVQPVVSTFAYSQPVAPVIESKPKDSQVPEQKPYQVSTQSNSKFLQESKPVQSVNIVEPENKPVEPVYKSSTQTDSTPVQPSGHSTVENSRYSRSSSYGKTTQPTQVTTVGLVAQSSPVQKKPTQTQTKQANLRQQREDQNEKSVSKSTEYQNVQEKSTTKISTSYASPVTSGDKRYRRMSSSTSSDSTPSSVTIGSTGPKTANDYASSYMASSNDVIILSADQSLPPVTSSSSSSSKKNSSTQVPIQYFNHY